MLKRIIGVLVIGKRYTPYVCHYTLTVYDAIYHICIDSVMGIAGTTFRYFGMESRSHEPLGYLLYVYMCVCKSKCISSKSSACRRHTHNMLCKHYTIYSLCESRFQHDLVGHRTRNGCQFLALCSYIEYLFGWDLCSCNGSFHGFGIG